MEIDFLLENEREKKKSNPNIRKKRVYSTMMVYKRSNTIHKSQDSKILAGCEPQRRVRINSLHLQNSDSDGGVGTFGEGSCGYVTCRVYFMLRPIATVFWLAVERVYGDLLKTYMDE